MTNHVLSVTGLQRSFTQGGERIDVLRGVDLHIAQGEIVALLGPSGSGKSTLLQAVGLLEGGFEGSILINGEQAAMFDAAERTRVRRESIGFVYQFHHLLPDFTASENVILPQLVKGSDRASAEDRAVTLLSTLGLGGRIDHRPSQLSGGEQQRVAVARALANRPALILADEPTGNLDEATADIVFDEFLRLVREEGGAALVATHNERLAARMDRVLRLHDGQLHQQPVTAAPTPSAAMASDTLTTLDAVVRELHSLQTHGDDLPRDEFDRRTRTLWHAIDGYVTADGPSDQ
jgi:lipoprotein-releasing system ATP-binding protein